MHALKCLARDTPRQHDPAGRNVLYACDCARIDYAQWPKWKQRGGIYLICVTKEKMNLTLTRENSIDRTDPQPRRHHRRRTRRDHRRDCPAADPLHASCHRGSV